MKRIEKCRADLRATQKKAINPEGASDRRTVIAISSYRLMREPDMDGPTQVWNDPMLSPPFYAFFKWARSRQISAPLPVQQGTPSAPVKDSKEGNWAGFSNRLTNRDTDLVTDSFIPKAAINDGDAKCHCCRLPKCRM
jgi:hypothetical protein